MSDKTQWWADEVNRIATDGTRYWYVPTKELTRNQIKFPEPSLNIDLSSKTTPLSEIQTLLNATIEISERIVWDKPLSHCTSPWLYHCNIYSNEKEGCHSHVYLRFSETGRSTFGGRGNTLFEALVSFARAITRQTIVKTHVHEGYDYESHIIKLGEIQLDLDSKLLFVPRVKE